MEKRKEGLAPFSSDECPNSGEDSDEDVITDYLGAAQPAECTGGGGVVNGDCDYTKDEGCGPAKQSSQRKQQPSAIIMSEASPQQQHLLPGVGAGSPLVPIISVTPHSPGLAKHYPILEEPLRHLHEIHDNIHQMRDLTLALAARAQQGDHLQRFSTSCPSLCPVISIDGIVQPPSSCGAQPQQPGQPHHHHHHHHHHEQDGSDPDLLTNCSTNSSPTHYPATMIGGPQSHVCSQILQGIDRRRSWTDLEDSRQRRGSDQNHLQAQNIRQRSISLSSLDSDMDLELDGKPRTRDTSSKNRAGVSQSSTHSLNEADFVQSEFKKVVVKRGGHQRLGDNVSLMPGVTGSRLPLQKSVSTPSIVIPPGQTHLTETGARVAPSLSARHERHEKGSGSETETDDLHIPHGHEFHEDMMMREGTPNTQASLDELLTDTAYDDRHSEKTKRKRGSLFSRKKKDKSGKKPAQHQWATINVSSQGNNSCDFCMKNFSNKPTLHCETCGAIIHSGCKDHYQPECTKSKPSSKSSFKSLSSVSLSSGTSIVKRGSTASLPLPASIGSGREVNNKKPVTCYSPWRRVATKLGVNQTISEERDGDGGSHRDVSSGLEEYDFDDVHGFNLEEFDSQHPELGLGREEPDSWSASIGRKVAMRLVDNNEREVKRQEHIYEFILTEKHHCLVLLAMQRIFVGGLLRHFHLNAADLDRMFPRLQHLMDIHFDFLSKLRQRQSENAVVPTIADILVEQFSGDNSYSMKAAYGEFCSRHRDAVDVYKRHQQNDPRFARFVRHCQNNPLLKKKGIPECILFVTQRLTKYPLLVEPLIKTGVTADETDNLRRALGLVKEILGEVDACVADKERTDRKLDIYHKIDAKSSVTYRGKKFKKSDILASNRNLKFEGIAWLMTQQGRGKPVVVVCLTDVLFFLAGEQKYTFFMPENKAGVVSLQKLLVREKAGQDSSIYLISSNPNEPQMFDLEVKEPRDKRVWIKAIRAAVEACPQEPDNETSNFMENNLVNEMRDARSLSLSKLSSEEKLRIAKENRLQGILDELRKKDEEQASLFEQKMELHLRLHQAINLPTDSENDVDKVDKDIPDYLRLVRGEGINSTQMWQEALEAVQEAMRLASSLSCGATGGTLSRSLSSAGERHSEAYVPPSLAVPRRAETFAGFDHNKERYPWRDSVALNSTAPPKSSEPGVGEQAEGKEEDELDVYRDQREVAVRLSHYVHTLLCIISNQMTTIENLQAQLAGFKEGSMTKSNNRPNPNRQLEELRNLQDQLSRERAEFRVASQQERSQLEEERAELNKLRLQLSAEQRDVEKQRDQLYRKLEALTRQGVSVTTATTAGTASSSDSGIGSGNTSTSRKKSQTDEKGMIPQHLFSATNQQKVQQLPVKQQLPLKLASGSNNSNSRSGSIISNNSPDRHSRTGSSPAIVTSSSTLSSPELGSSSQHNNGSSSLSHFSMSNRSLRSTRIPEPYPRKHHVQQQQQQQQQQHQQQQQQQQQQQKAEPQQPLEEEVLFL